MNKVLKDKILEAFASVLPITVIVLLATVILAPVPAGTVLLFICGAALLIIGMGFFTLGADMAMMPIGEGLGATLTHALSKSGSVTKHPVLRSLVRALALAGVLVVVFIIGVVITIAEPDLQVLADQVSAIPRMALVVTVGIGVGLFLVIAVLRTLLGIPLGILLVVLYVITFGAAAFCQPDFLPVAFDAGGVTTGPITVPFILSFGVGVASLRSDKNSQNDSFGLVSLCSVGPILAVLALSILFKPHGGSVDISPIPDVGTSRDVVTIFLHEMPGTFSEIIRALGAILVFFVVFQVITRRFKKHQVGRIAVGFVYTLIGLVVFMTGVDVGFIPVGQLLGQGIGASAFKWVLVPFAVVVGYFIVAAEPAVHVLNKQVEDISSGAIPQSMMNMGLSVGMAFALAVTMTRILLNIPIMYILSPGYAVALLLTFFVPKIFTGIAFDSGGVCSGPMTSTFLLPFAMGVAKGTGGDIMKDAFGIVAMVAMTPLVVIQLIGVVYGLRTRKAAELAAAGGYTDEGAIVIYGPEER
jgi:hypothetical protein